MNKKVLTLCAGLVLAGSANVWAEKFVQTSVSNGYQIQTAFFVQENVVSVDNTTAVNDANKGLFPTVSPFAVSVANGAKPISELEYVNGKEESRYFQFVVGEQGDGSDEKRGLDVLTMVWVGATDNLGNPIQAQGHYELQIENVANANIPENRILLDRTLWKVTVEKETAGAGNTLYYTLQNKATDAILQLTIDDEKPAAQKAKAVAPTIVAGQTQWRWAQGEKATVGSKVDLTANVGPVLQGVFSAQFDNGTVLVLAKKEQDSKAYFTPVMLNSNDLPTFLKTGLKDENNDRITYKAVTFESWEANPIILTADQINTELGNEVLNPDTKDGKFNFTFAPDVQGFTNIMTSGKFIAEPAIKDATTRVPGDAADGFVRFKNDNGYLMVDTTYYNEEAQDRYELQMTVANITFPRQAVVADKNNNVYKDIEAVQKAEADKSLYTATTPSYSAAAYIQLKRQSNFRPIFYPATQTLKLQAEMIYKKAKDGRPWWQQVKEDIVSNHLHIAQYALKNDANPLSTTGSHVNAVGYYPAYTAATVTTPSNEAAARALAYASAYKKPDAASGVTNGYNKFGAAYTSGQDVWNAVANLKTQDTGTAGVIDGNDMTDVAGLSTYPAMLVMDPARTTGAYEPVIYSPLYVQANSNVVKLVTLMSSQKALTTDIADPNDAIYNGLLTNISLAGLRQTSDIDHTTANIPEGFYYIQNANKSNTLVAAYDDYRYEDLAATNATEMYWNETRGTTGDWDIRNTDADEVSVGNLVYSEDKLIIPSAQWYIKGDGNHYKMYNRESGRQWGTEYWWATGEEGVYVNQATYTDAAGQQVAYRDTIRLTAVPAADLHKPHLGYLWMEQDEAMADTTVFNMGITSLGDVNLSLSVDANGNMIMTPDSTGAYKLERVRKEFTDSYDGKKHAETELMYGYTTEAADTLVRAQYYIYKDEVNANSGIEPSSIKTRQYITLDGGKYKLSKVQVTFDNDLYTTEVDGENVRRAFYVKQITPAANQFVLVDPDVVNVVENNTGNNVKGARVFINQFSGELQPGSLVSDGYSNPYANSILNLDKISKQNYADIRGGKDRMNAKFFVEDDNTWLLGENGAVKGSNVGLLELRKQDADICNSIFVDTANVHDAAFPRFLLAVRNVDSTEVSNIPNHNHHILTKGAYLVNMIDSAATNNVYKYVNRDFNNTEWYRLGFVNATHQGDSLAIDGTTTTFDLSTEGLDKTGGLNYATFAFRYVDTERDNFYIETAYKGTTKGWVKIHNGVAVVTPDIQEAEVFSFETTDEYATANETIAAEGAVSVVATDGAVIVKGAEGKNVVIATILGKVVANETINSDNETIAVPAGIAVVSVDGESFKVVVK